MVEGAGEGARLLAGEERRAASGEMEVASKNHRGLHFGLWT